MYLVPFRTGKIFSSGDYVLVFLKLFDLPANESRLFLDVKHYFHFSTYPKGGLSKAFILNFRAPKLRLVNYYGKEEYTLKFCEGGGRSIVKLLCLQKSDNT